MMIDLVVIDGVERGRRARRSRRPSRREGGTGSVQGVSPSKYIHKREMKTVVYI